MLPSNTSCVDASLQRSWGLASRSQRSEDVFNVCRFLLGFIEGYMIYSVRGKLC